MNQETFITQFMERLRQQLGDLLPQARLDAVMDQARRALHQEFSDLDLVPRRELEARFRTLDELQRTVEALEARLRTLESR